MKIKTSEAVGPALNWLVATALGWVNYPEDSVEMGRLWHTEPLKGVFGNTRHVEDFCPSTDWAQGGPIIEREECWPTRYYGAAESRGKVYQASLGAGTYSQGPTPLIAAMRCFICSRLGDEVEIPEELA